MKRSLISLAALALVACGSDRKPSERPNSPDTTWAIEYSWAMPDYIIGNSFQFPLAPGHVNYVTEKVNGLAGKTRVVMRYRIEANDGVKIVPNCCPDMLSVGPTIYFQRRDDDMRTDGWRWWATFNSPIPIEPGEYTLTVNFNDNWTSVLKMSAKTNPREFKLALDNAARIGFTFGGGTGYGHGVYATGPATFILEEFKIE